jgi:hypothetical protein
MTDLEERISVMENTWKDLNDKVESYRKDYITGNNARHQESATLDERIEKLEEDVHRANLFINKRLEKLEKSDMDTNHAFAEVSTKLSKLELALHNSPPNSHLKKEIAELKTQVIVDNSLLGEQINELKEQLNIPKERLDLAYNQRLILKEVLRELINAIKDIHPNLWVRLNELLQQLEGTKDGDTVEVEIIDNEFGILRRIEGEKSVSHEGGGRVMVGSSPILTDSTPSNKADMIMYDGEVTVVETDDLKRIINLTADLLAMLTLIEEKYLSEEK